MTGLLCDESFSPTPQLIRGLLYLYFMYFSSFAPLFILVVTIYALIFHFITPFPLFSHFPNEFFSVFINLLNCWWKDCGWCCRVGSLLDPWFYCWNPFYIRWKEGRRGFHNSSLGFSSVMYLRLRSYLTFDIWLVCMVARFELVSLVCLFWIAFFHQHV